MRLTLAETRAIALKALGKLGYNPDDSAVIADHLVDSAARGERAGGLQRILVIEEHLATAKVQPITVTRETSISAALDGGGEIGFLVAYRATERAIAKTLAHGIGIVTANNNAYTGHLGYYCEMAAKAGLVVIAAGNTGPFVAPFGAAEAVIGTNPIAMGFPTQDEPVIWDVGAGSTSIGALLFAQRQGLELPEGVAVDGDGNATRDPTAALAGAIRPWGGHKGAGLAVMTQILGGILAGTDPLPGRFEGWGFFIQCFQPELLLPAELFRTRVSEFAETVRNAKPMPGTEGARMPFDGSRQARIRTATEGVEMPDALYQQVLALAEG